MKKQNICGLLVILYIFLIFFLTFQGQKETEALSDGVNNLVILIDVNSGTNPSTTSFKAFDGSVQQAMMYRSDSNADPINITFDASYIGTYDGYTCLHKLI